MKEELRKEFEHFLGPNSHWNPSVEPSIDFIDQAIDYAIAIEHLTDGMIGARYTLAKLSEIKTIRLKDFVPGEDDSIQVNGVSVTSLDYKKIRPASVNIVYQGADNRYESIIAILEEKEILLSGKLEKIGGIDFSNSVAVTKEFYTQLASYMGTTIIPHKNLSVLEVNGTTYTDPVTIGDRLFFTGKTTLKEDYYQGFTTMEYTRSTGEVTVLDHLDREICEVIAKKVMRHLGISFLDDGKGKYATALMEKGPEMQFVTKYMTNSKKLAKEYMRHIVADGIDIIHYLEDRSNLQEEILDEKLTAYFQNGQELKPVTKEQALAFEEAYITHLTK